MRLCQKTHPIETMKKRVRTKAMESEIWVMRHVGLTSNSFLLEALVD